MKNEGMDLRQFKLTSGEEIVCEIVQWNDNMELEIVVRKAMRLVMQEGTEGVKYYSFRPWMVYQESEEDLMIINGNNVVGIGFPPEVLLVQYFEAVEEMFRMNIDRVSEYVKTAPKTTEQKLDQYLKTNLSLDSGSNVIDMFDPKKIH